MGIAEIIRDRKLKTFRLRRDFHFEHIYVCFLGNIGSPRKRGIWKKGEGSKIYFTCPKCGGVNATHKRPDSARADSVICSKCDRHLWNLYLTEKAKMAECSLIRP